MSTLCATTSAIALISNGVVIPSGIDAAKQHAKTTPLNLNCFFFIVIPLYSPYFVTDKPLFPRLICNSLTILRYLLL